MCGFTGYFLKNSIESNSTVILDMLELQRHRGPDDSGVLGINTRNNIMEELPIQMPNCFSSKPNLIFGFNRLSILDLSPAGHQPMINKDAKVALMMNGEVYNAFDYKPELEAKGYIFKGQSDTEVVLNLYLAYGLEEMLNRLNGMYALAIYDGRKEALFLVRDRVGIKPLYVLQETNRIAFSSEMKSFKSLPYFKFELDESKLSEFLLFRNTINGTLFKNIVNIEPGTYWRIDNKGAIEVNCYYDLRSEGNEKANSTKYEFEQTLRNSVKRQMISDVKLGCQLSGGVDSSLITAFASESLPKGSLETISVIVNSSVYSEKQYIDYVVKSLDLLSHQILLNSDNYFKMLDEAIWHFEQPLNHPNSIGIKLLSKEAKKHVTVLLSGEGADEALAGYSRFLPTSMKLVSLNVFKRALKNKNKIFTFIKSWLNKVDRYLIQTSYSNYYTISTVYPKFSKDEALKSRKLIYNSISSNSVLKKRKYELLTYLPDLLMRQDKMSMAHSIENRVPFLDNEVLKIALNIDDDFLVNKNNGNWEGKDILKQICSEVFEKKFSYRNKMGFGIPLKAFFSSENFQKRWDNEILPGIKKRGIFNTKQVSKWMKHLNNLNSEQLDTIWILVGFEIWAKQYID